MSNFCKFLDNGPSPYHVVQTASRMLEAKGFKRLNLGDKWSLQAGGRYYLTKAYSTLCAFVVGGKYHYGNGYVIVGSHTDSPCLKVRPISRLCKEGIKQVAVDTYGGGIWYTWMDRNLSLAGLVTYQGADGVCRTKVVDLQRPLLYVPNLAIHLTREDSPKINKEEHLQPIFTLDSECTPRDKEAAVQSTPGDHHAELLVLIAKEVGCNVEALVDFDLRAYNTEKATLGGLSNEFVFGARLDNLVSVYASVNALIASAESNVDEDPATRIAFCFDHEEVGSCSAAGARSDVVAQVLRRITVVGDELIDENYSRGIHKSFIVSADQAHAVHPNYADKHERNHRPRMDGSVVVKINANQRYASTSLSQSILTLMAQKANVNIKKFVVKNDSLCGSTIGPFISQSTAALTIDIGCPQLAMHSIRECGDTKSVDSLERLLKEVYSTYGVSQNKLLIRDD